MSHPNWSPELAASVAAIREHMKDGNPRKQYGTTKCISAKCGKRAVLYVGDPRARGWLRGECKHCGEWWDRDPSFKPKRSRAAPMKRKGRELASPQKGKS